MDENLPDALAQALYSLEPPVRVRRVGEGIAPPLGTDDPALLIWVEEHDFVLLTNNRRSMPVHLAEHLAAGRHVPGVLQVPRKHKLGELAEFLQAVYWASLPDEYRDRITHLSTLMGK